MTTHHFHATREVSFPNEEMSPFTHWKYAVKPGFQTIQMPKSAEILEVNGQKMALVIHALIDTREVEAKEFRKIEIFVVETGAMLPWRVVNDFEFIGTKRLTSSAWFYHVYLKEVNQVDQTPEA